MDVHTPEQRSRNMRAIKSIGTKAEVQLAKALWNLGYRYRKNDKKVFGKPDLTFKKYKLAIFVDSEFFHGKDWDTEKHCIKTNTEFWHKKIERNIERDREVTQYLEKSGWKVLRFWEKDIRKKLTECLIIIEHFLK
ncbi:very short patch repair endonuclease [Elizabethkingia anophelis]|uniref:Very short patch repair endonuclease n=1 Tax=Elizabethkingia anophelis TaxID=1117645 RepID=A0AAU8VIP8_9FLAO|nr:very short patch repair endonuclease [Elizabethkingia anophelis]AQX02806.1 very short patch repair endonuclease [Elizabethkingia anophelis]OPB56834.1 very short patch repair endonuclease [Elizabethkingia anophelis]